MNKSDLIWEVSIRQLIVTFRDGLNALIPVANNAKIPWRSGESYDGWDTIANVLYENIILNSIKHSNHARFAKLFSQYDMQGSNYHECSFIRVRSPQIDEEAVACFINLVEKKDEFSDLHCVVFGADGEFSKQLTFEDATFSLQLYMDSDQEVTFLKVAL